MRGGKGDMNCSCLLGELGSDKGCFLCGGGVIAVNYCSFKLLFRHAPFRFYWDAVYSHVFEECGGGVRAWGQLVKLMWASCLYRCLENLHC